MPAFKPKIISKIITWLRNYGLRSSLKTESRHDAKLAATCGPEDCNSYNLRCRHRRQIRRSRNFIYKLSQNKQFPFAEFQLFIVFIFAPIWPAVRASHLNLN